MKRKTTIWLLVIGVLAITAALGGTIYRTVSAANGAALSNAKSILVNSLPPMMGNYGREMLGSGATNSDLATALGITTDALNAAYTKANEAALAKAVELGLITQAQADELKSSGRAFPFEGRWDGWLSQKGIDYNALLAEALGIKVEDLQAAYAKAYTARIDAAVTAGNLTQEQADLLKGQYALFNSKTYQSAMQTAFETAIKQAVTDGVISQAQADLILKNATTNDFPGGKGFGFGCFGGRGFEGPRGGGRGGGRGKPGGFPGFDQKPDDNTIPTNPTQSPSSSGGL